MAKSNECRRNRPLCMDAGDLAPHVVEFTRQLLELGHTGLTVAGYDAAARHFAQWLALSRIAVADTDNAVIDRFARHRCRCPGARRETRVSETYVRRARRFVGFLGERGIVRPQAKVTSPPFDRRVVEFQDWLRQHRGITELTIGRHGHMVMRLLPALGSKPRSWNAQLIRDVIMAETKRASRAYVKTMAMALRGYLRFLGARGLCRVGLEHAVPTIPQWRLSALPRYIGGSDIECLIGACPVPAHERLDHVEHRKPRARQERHCRSDKGREPASALGCDGNAARRRDYRHDRRRAASPISEHDRALRQGRRCDAAADRAALAGRRAMLSRDLARYVDQQRALGFKFRLQHILLRGFVAFAEEYGDRHIKSARVLAWAARAPSPEQRRNRLLTVRRFALAMRAESRRHQVPPADALGHAVAKRRSPYIYSADAVARLLGAAVSLQPADSIRPAMYATLFGLLAATGMRIAEALALQLDDVTADGLVIRETKFQKSRLLPLHTTTREALDRYLALRGTIAASDCALFVSVVGRALSYNTVRGTFLQLLDRANLQGAASGRDPRIHDLRHTFAVRSLEQCSHDRAAVARHIVALSTYLGHAHVTDTYWYLQATPLLMGQIAQAGEALLWGGAA